MRFFPSRPSLETSAPLPPVIYFPGWPGTGLDNLDLIDKLAGAGFPVAAITYPSQSAASALTPSSAAERLRHGVEDLSALLDSLPTAFARARSHTQCGVVGFSFGGAIAAEAAGFEPRVRAVVNIDGRHWGQALARGVKVPYLFIGEELRVPTPQQIAAARPDQRCELELDRVDYINLAANLRRNGGTQVTIAGAAHMDFSDAALRLHLRRRLAAAVGRVTPRRCLRIMQAYVRAFLRRELAAADSAALADGARRFPQADCQVWPRPEGVQTR